MAFLFRSPRAARPDARAGFTLAETIVALLLTSVVVILVSTTFIVQNRYYSTQRQRSLAHDVVRSGTDLVASEIRSVMTDGVIVAGARTLTVRTPMAVLLGCDTGGSHVTVFLDGGLSAVDTAEVGGLAVRDSVTAAWTYANGTWGDIDRGGGDPDRDCDDHGADTTSASSDFYRLDRDRMNTMFGFEPEIGSVLMLFRETTYSFQKSGMDDSSVGLFRQSYGGSAVEYASGFDDTAQFQYRTGGASYGDTVVAANLGSIDVVRIVAEARGRVAAGATDDVTFGWSVNVALRNTRDE